MCRERTSCKRELRNFQRRPDPGARARATNVSRANSIKRMAASGLSVAMRAQIAPSSNSTHADRMNSVLFTGCLDSFAKTPEHDLAIQVLAGVQRFNRLQQTGFELVHRGGQAPEPGFAFFFEPAQAGANHLTRGLVKTATDLIHHKFFQFRRQ